MDLKELSLNIDKDHWAFLDEIEAPMWVDLKLEEKSNYQDIDDEWFYTSHVFHQCSSLRLKAAFAHSGEGSASSGIIDLNGQSSPKLPSSVLNSRGKRYASKKQSGNSHAFLLDKKHPAKALSRKPSCENSGFHREVKHKLSFVNPKGTSRSKTNLVIYKDVIKTSQENNFKAVCNNADSEGSLSSKVDKQSQSNTSTITCENNQKLQQKGLVSAMRINLRKSCIKRPASRVDVSNNNNRGNRRQSRDSNSMSGKSSVGSSSNPAYDSERRRLTLMQQRDQTPNSKNEARINRATKNELRCKTAREKALLPYRANLQLPLSGAAKAKEKFRVDETSGSVGAGSENLTGRVPLFQKCNNGDTFSRVLVRGQKAIKQHVAQKDDISSRLKGKISSRPSRDKHSTKATQSVFLR